MIEAARLDPSRLASWATDEVVQVGPLTLRIISDVPAFPALNYFSRGVRTVVTPPGAALSFRPDAELWCVSGSDPPPGWPADRSARARGFSSGYYVTDHFGSPVHMTCAGRRITLFGQRLEQLVWPYFVKQQLLLHAVGNGGLFLKAAALAVNGTGTMLVGRGGAGKTVMVAELCRNGARFVTNSHAIISDGSLCGVFSSMRMRPGPWVDQLAAPMNVAISQAEVMIDPLDAFGAPPAAPVTVTRLLVVDYRGPGEHRIEMLRADETFGMLEQFALGLNVYRLEEDLLDDFGGDYRAFSVSYDKMKARLRDLVRTCQSFAVSTDVRQSARRDQLLELISRG